MYITNKINIFIASFTVIKYVLKYVLRKIVKLKLLLLTDILNTIV